MADVPEVPELPTINHLDQASMRSRLLVMRGSVPAELRADGRYLWLYVHLTRVTDKAIREYNAARDNAHAFGTDSGRGPHTLEEVSEMPPYLLWANDHLESCVDAAHRAVEAVKILQVEGIGTKAPQPNGGSLRRLRDIRH